MARARLALALLALALLAGDALAARMFDSHKHPALKREVKRRKKAKDQFHWESEELDYDHLGRAAFDPAYGMEEGLQPEDLGFHDHDVHDASKGVIEYRLKQLFPTIDANHDGVITSEELQRHLYENGRQISRRRADLEFTDVDTNQDGRVTAAEYLVHSLEGLPPHTADAVNAFRMPDPLDWASYVDVTLAAMVHADKGGNKGLARDEFYDFLNPEEGSNVALKLHRLRQDIYEHLSALADTDHPYHPAAGQEQSLDAAQFYKSFWPQFSVWEHRSDEVFSEERERAAADRRFFLLDTNADHLLTAEELLPVYADIHPTESRYARMQAEHMMDMAECKDDRLTQEQMLRVPHAFYSVTHAEEHSEL